MAVDPRGADLKRYLAEDPGGPVVMLNLLRFAPDGGRAQYLRYVEHFRRTSTPFGAEVLNGELRVGEVLSGRDGAAMALLRLDRIDSALTVEGRPVTVSRPDWTGL